MPTIDTSLLRVAYHVWEPAQPLAAQTVVLLHGWPDSPRCWAQLAPDLAAAGYRVLAPALRGFSPTTFLSAHTPRTGQLAALGRDVVELVQAWGLHKPVLVGHDWGARAAANACGLAPGLAGHLVLISVGYGTNNPQQTLSMAQLRLYWYHWFMATERGQATVRTQGKAFAQAMWDTWSPPGWYSAEEFEATAPAFANPDWPEVTLHSYCHRWGHAPGDPAYAADDAALNPAPVLAVPTLMLHGGADGVSLPETSAGKEAFFSGPYERLVLPGLGHFPQREAPQTVSAAVLRFLAAHPA